MDIAVAECRKYEAMWNRPEYRERSPGLRMCADAKRQLEAKPGDTICDFGAGTGRASKWWADNGCKVTAFDIAANAITEFDGTKVIGNLWAMPNFGKFDYGFCCDVLEHLPTEHVGDAILGISRRVTKAAYFQIALFECHMGAAIGEHLHLTVKPPAWWRRELASHFKKVTITPARKYVIALCQK